MSYLRTKVDGENKRKVSSNEKREQANARLDSST